MSLMTIVLFVLAAVVLVVGIALIFRGRKVTAAYLFLAALILFLAGGASAGKDSASFHAVQSAGNEGQ